MDILFVVDRPQAQEDPNLNLVRQLLPFLEQQGKVYFLGHTPCRSEAKENCFYFGMDEKVRELYFSLQGCTALQKAGKLLRHPVLSCFGLLKAFHLDCIAGAYRCQIEQAVKRMHPDVVVAVAAPYYTAKAVAAARLPDCKKAIYMFDPYGMHYLMGGAAAKRQEKRCIAKVDAVFVPELLAVDYTQPNVMPLAFPGLVPLPASSTGISGSAVKKAEDTADAQPTLQLAFVGSLYADIRSPVPLLRLLKLLPAPLVQQVHLTVVGGLYGTYSADFHEEFDAWMKQHVTFVGKVTHVQALEQLRKADVLVNIGNKVGNQLPSKIFEYFATGKPILNLKQLEACPADSYMARYPLAMTVDVTQPLTPAVAQKAAAFLQKNVGQTLPWETVLALYGDNTPAAVAQKLLSGFTQEE